MNALVGFALIQVAKVPVQNPLCPEVPTTSQLWTDIMLKSETRIPARSELHRGAHIFLNGVEDYWLTTYV